MRQLKLKLEDLRVESFTTGEADLPKGTVRAHQEEDTAAYTCEETCPPKLTCGNTCAPQYTCEETCPPKLTCTVECVSAGTCFTDFFCC